MPHGSHRTASSYNSFRTYVNVSTNQAASSAVASDTQPATIDVQHAEFVAQAKAKSRFEADKGKSQGNPEGKLAGGEGLSTSRQAVKGFASAMQNGECASSQSGAHSGTYTGRLSSTSSHLFKLIVPLPPSLHAALGIQGSDSASCPPSKVVDTAFLLHPSQPLSHVSRLILGSLPASERDADVEFRAVSGRDHAAYPSPTKGTEEADETTDDEGGPLLYERNPEGEDLQEVRWSTSTDLGDFIKQATLAQHFRIVLKPSWEAGMGQSTPLLKDRVPTVKVVGSGSAEHSKHPEKQSESTSQSSKDESVADFPELSLKIMIPSFESRTRFLRKRLLHLTRQIAEVTQKKKELDRTAHKGARRIAVGGLMGLVGYWGVVFKLTFYSSYGWDLMEPVTYLSGLSTLIISYLFFLYRVAEDYDYDWKGQLENLENTSIARPLSANGSTDQHVSANSHSRQEMRAGSANTTQDEAGQAGGAVTLSDGTISAQDEAGIDVDATINEAVELEEQTRMEQNRRRRGKGSKGEIPKVEKQTA
ncbi:hypothetical protein NCC49_002164 [Naganishia albida]|nr:hypothetical protein NCC49_002164 [Naganishia albida]